MTGIDIGTLVAIAALVLPLVLMAWELARLKRNLAALQYFVRRLDPNTPPAHPMCRIVAVGGGSRVPRDVRPGQARGPVSTEEVQ